MNVSFDPVFLICVGFFLFIFSLHHMLSVFRKEIPVGFLAVGRWLVAHPISSFFIATLVTILVQYSAITIFLAMWAVEVGLVSTGNGILLMLGASLGTTLKGAVFVDSGSLVVKSFVILSGIAVILSKRIRGKASLEFFITVALLVLSMNLLTWVLQETMLPWCDLLLTHAWSTESLLGALGGVGSGTALAFLLQSSTSAVVLIIESVSGLQLSFVSVVIMVIGANIGTALPEVILGFLLFGRSARKVGTAHLVSKSLTAIFCLLFLKSFIVMIDWMGSAFGWESSYWKMVFLAHFLFNLINVTTWFLLKEMLLFLVKGFATKPEPPLAFKLARVIGAYPEHTNDFCDVLDRDIDSAIRDARLRIEYLISGACYTKSVEAELLEAGVRLRSHLKSAEEIALALLRCCQVKGENASRIALRYQNIERLLAIQSILDLMENKRHSGMDFSLSEAERKAHFKVWEDFYTGVSESTKKASVPASGRATFLELIENILVCRSQFPGGTVSVSIENGKLALAEPKILKLSRAD